MYLQELAEASARVGATRSRLAKRDLLAELLRRVPVAELEIVTAYLSGRLTQRRTGVGWRSLTELPDPAEGPGTPVAEVDAALGELAVLAGPGSGRLRERAVAALFARLTAEEQRYLRGLITGEVRQGALDALLLEAIAQAADVPVGKVRAAAMYSAPTGPIAVAAMTGGSAALAGFAMVAGRPVRPMLASSAPDLESAWQRVCPKAGEPVAVDAKLDGIRIQVHRLGDEVRVFTRSLDDIGERLPEVAAAARALPVDGLVLDGEAMTLDGAGRPRPFQETAARTATSTGTAGVRPFFFDLLMVDGRSLVDEPLEARLAELDALVPVEQRAARLVTDSPRQAREFYERVVDEGQEGVVVKRLDAPYAAGRRGAAWVKVKPRHTLDLVVLAVEWGSGRRRGRLSNIHLGARDPDTGGFTMLGKTFKGMSDEMLAWQTERFLELETSREGHVVHVRPEQVVEIAFDGLQRSTRYPGGVALRFARVLRYRDDKAAEEADTIATVRSLATGRPAPTR